MFTRQIGIRLVLLALVLPLALGSAGGKVTAAVALVQPPDIRAQSAILIELNSGQVLYSKGAEQAMYPASLTKLLTALVVLKYGGELEQTVAVGREVWWVRPNSSRAGLQLHDRISLRNLFYALLLPSGNDAAYVAAVHTARAYVGDPALSIEAALQTFCALMNQEAERLGAQNSNFVNPDGYHDDRHYSTARDLALIAGQVLKQQFLRQVVGQAQITVEYVNQGRRISRSYVNTNRLINPEDPLYYPQAVGLKTGTTALAGASLAAAASANRMDLVAIVLNSDHTGRWSDSRALLDYGFGTYQFLQLCAADQPQAEVKLASRLPGFYADAALISQQEAEVFIAKADSQRVARQFVFDPAAVTHRDGVAVVQSHLQPGDVVGELVFALDQEQIAVVPLVLGEGELVYRPSSGAMVAIALATVLLGICGYLLYRQHYSKNV
jgi:D-alanyl-D-alanine carboxypeptidase (penicillin-binding protein 5/6)